jgi:peptidoglycan/xylan/chitin deacetylase (PgdA/CDA1 family)
VPVLAYDEFSIDNPTGKGVLPKDFKSQMSLLKKTGFRVITLDQLLDFLNFKKQLPDKSIVLTFDSGRNSFKKIAYPVLKSYGYPATVFIYPQLVGNRGKMSWKDLKQLHSYGINIQPHSLKPRNLAKREENKTPKRHVEQLQKEILTSKKMIDKKLSKNCRYLAYPFGAANSLVMKVLKNNGFKGAFTLNSKSNPFYVNNFGIGRVKIDEHISSSAFRKKLDTFIKKDLR